MDLVETVYRCTACFPDVERYGLSAQMRRAAVSIPSNIAEGAARNSRGEFLQFLGITCGSIAELETQIELAGRLGYLESGTELAALAQRVGRVVRRLRTSMKPLIRPPG